MSYKINGIEMVTASEIVEATGWTRTTIDKKMKRFNYTHVSLRSKEIKGLYERYGRVWNGTPSKLNLYPLSVKEELISMSKRRKTPLNALATIPTVEEKEENGTMSSLMAGIIAENPEFGKVRVVRDENGECYMVASDVASALQYEVPADAVAKHIDSDDKFTLKSKDKSMVIQNMRIAYNSVIIGFVPPLDLHFQNGQIDPNGAIAGVRYLSLFADRSLKYKLISSLLYVYKGFAKNPMRKGV